MALNNKTIRVFSILMILGTFLGGCQNKELKNEKASTEEFQPTWESLKKAKPAQWWQDGKFGIFIHWGPYSVAGYKDRNKGYAEAITQDLYKKPERYKEWMIKKFGAAPPAFGYKDMVPLFKAENWNPEEWAQLFKESGARYVIPTGEHHDGFVNWDSKLTPWTATKKGPMRDLIGDLAKAVRKEGLKYGISYHRERHPSRFTPVFQVIDTAYAQVLEEIKRMPEAASLYGPFVYDDAFIADYVARWQEAQTKYQPDFMWIDDVPILRHGQGDPQVEKFNEAFKIMIADYLNAGKKWGKEVYFNNKGKSLNFPEGIGCVERDNLQMDEIGKPWQNPATLGTSYAYMEHEELTNAYKNVDELIWLLCDIVSKNGNLLLNIGPKADGTIPEGMVTRLKEMGKWLKVNGEAIYETRPWEVYGEFEGEFTQSKDELKTKHSMRVHKTEYRYTKKPNTIYAIAFQNKNKELLKSFAGKKVQIESIEIVGGAQNLEWKLTAYGLEIESSSVKSFEYARVYKIKTK